MSFGSNPAFAQTMVEAGRSLPKTPGKSSAVIWGGKNISSK